MSCFGPDWVTPHTMFNPEQYPIVNNASQSIAHNQWNNLNNQPWKGRIVWPIVKIIVVHWSLKCGNQTLVTKICNEGKIFSCQKWHQRTERENFSWNWMIINYCIINYCLSALCNLKPKSFHINWYQQYIYMNISSSNDTWPNQSEQFTQP